MTPDEKVLIEVETNVELKAHVRQALREEWVKLVGVGSWLVLALMGMWIFTVLLAVLAGLSLIGTRVVLIGWKATIDAWKESVGYVEEKE